METAIINVIIQKMLPYLNNSQAMKLKDVLNSTLFEGKIDKGRDLSNLDLLDRFISAKRVEGCSPKTLNYYRTTLIKLMDKSNKHVTTMLTEDLRDYLSNYHQASQCSQTNLDNVRRIFSSFFSWLENEDYIIKSPVRRINKIRTVKSVKETYSDEALVRMRDSCKQLRDLAIIDLLASTGMRVGELVKLNKSDIDFENRECIVFGKGSKERPVYFDARTKIHLKNYLDSRSDTNPALFVSLLRPFNRLEISGVEIRLRQLGEKLGIDKVHPHKFRRTLATKAIDKGMPIEQVQLLLGHSKIDTTMEYAMVNQTNVKTSHRKYIS